MKRTDTLIIGGGQAGLAMSRCLTSRGIDHVVLERGRIAERWRSERWDSSRLLTPNWMNRLPNRPYMGPDRDGYMSAGELASHMEDYATSFAAPIETGTTVSSVDPLDNGYRVTTDRGTWISRNVVIATGHCDVPYAPSAARGLSSDIEQLAPTWYRNPERLQDGGVLVVGAAASGIQLAEEIQASGRQVTLAVGRHIRLPRLYRGRDILWWLDAMGTLGESIHDMQNLEASRQQPSLQLVGREDFRSIDLNSLQDAGVRLVGRATAAQGTTMQFAGDLARMIGHSDTKLRSLLSRIDDWATSAGIVGWAPPGAPIQPIVPPKAPTSLDLRAEGIRTVIWCTGFKRNYRWLNVPVLDSTGEIRHQGGVTPAPGLYVMGLKMMRRRNSSFIGGVGADAQDLAGLIAGRLRAVA